MSDCDHALTNLLRGTRAALAGLAVAAALAGATGARGAGQNSGIDQSLDESRDTKTIVFFGDSLTAGYGLDNPDKQGYPALIQAKIRKAGLPWRVVNAGLSGETSAGGLRRVDWVLHQPVDIFVLELGGNDGLRGMSPSVTQANLQAIIDRVRRDRPHARIVIEGMRMPPSMGEDYTRAFAAVYPAVAQKNGAVLVPFLLDGVGGRPAMNQGDGIHPTAQGDRRVADNVWKVLRPMLEPPKR